MADDLAQETFLRAWRHADRFRAGGSYVGWLLSIAWRGVTLQPGLPVTVHVTTHPRSLISYLLQPIEEAAGSAFRQD